MKLSEIIISLQHVKKIFLHKIIFFLYKFRYGREDEEVMGLKFCNEAIIALQQIWPKIETEQRFDQTPLQVI